MHDDPEVRRLGGDDPLARALVSAMEDEYTPLYGPPPGPDGSRVDPLELAPPTGAYVALLANGRPAAGGGVRRLAPGVGEIKRMYVVPERRGTGLGRRLLAELEAAARDLGYARLRLDTTGSVPRFYESAGYVAVAPYNDNPYATYWGEKAL